MGVGMNRIGPLAPRQYLARTVRQDFVDIHIGGRSTAAMIDINGKVIAPDGIRIF
jgi:hypothetical protein